MNNHFSANLEKTGEVGYVKKQVQSIIYVDGLPTAHLNELIFFENGATGLVFSLGEKYVEVLFLSGERISVGDRATRTGGLVGVDVGDFLLGSVVDSLGKRIDGGGVTPEKTISIDQEPRGMLGREQVDTPFQTGVKMVDMVIPLGKGQRELVVGDRKTGKTLFLMQTLLAQAKRGTVCIYAGIGKRQQDIRSFLDFIESQGIQKNVITVLSGAAEDSGKVFLTPFTAMTIAEYFRDKGVDTFIIMDDMTTHATYYREISLQARRFPGRSSYPGNIFYIHAKLMERAGNFDTASITCMPVAESVLGDLSGYIQTNLMAMTDGHIYFDIDRFNQGQRPSVNPFLSVTRVGLQAQSPLVREVSRQVSSFLVQLENMKDFMHFGAEMSQGVKDTISLGDRVMSLFEQDYRNVVPVNATIYLVARVWAGLGKGEEKQSVVAKCNEIIKDYQTNKETQTRVDEMILGSPSFKDLVAKVKEEGRINEG